MEAMDTKNVKELWLNTGKRLVVFPDGKVVATGAGFLVQTRAESEELVLIPKEAIASVVLRFDTAEEARALVTEVPDEEAGNKDTPEA